MIGLQLKETGPPDPALLLHIKEVMEFLPRLQSNLVLVSVITVVEFLGVSGEIQ